MIAAALRFIGRHPVLAMVIAAPFLWLFIAWGAAQIGAALAVAING